MNTNECKPSNKDPIIIVGAGWSGLACAITLVNAGYSICLLESSKYPGGRAREVKFKNNLTGLTVDNGQHIMLGAYHYTREILRNIGINENDVYFSQVLTLELYSPRVNIQLKAPHLPAPFHLVAALLRKNGFALSDKINALSMLIKMSLKQFKITQDISVLQLLQQHQQSQQIISALWEPLCLATMNTPINNASSHVFLKVIQDSFAHSKKDSELLFFKCNLSQAFVKPAIDFLRSKESQVIMSHKVNSIEVSKEDSTSPVVVFTTRANNLSWQSSHVVLATPPYVTKKLINSINNQSINTIDNILLPTTATLDFAYHPICTVYLQYSPETQLGSPMKGLFDTMAQWVIDRTKCNQPGLMAVVISGPGHHLTLSTTDLIKHVHNELKLIIKDLEEPIDAQVIIEKRATFSCHVNISQQRPYNKTKIPGLFLAGDYTNTQYPATLEGAIRSGVWTAQEIIKQRT